MKTPLDDETLVAALAEHLRENYGDPLVILAQAAGPRLRNYMEALPAHQRRALGNRPCTRFGFSFVRQTYQLTD